MYFDDTLTTKHWQKFNIEYAAKCIFSQFLKYETASELTIIHVDYKGHYFLLHSSAQVVRMCPHSAVNRIPSDNQELQSALPAATV